MPEQLAKGGRDASIARLAGIQHGVLSSMQLQAAGLSTSSIGDRVAAGRLHRIHRGVYAVGHPNLSDEGRWMAAVLACGHGAVLSHRSAAALWRLAPVAKVIDVTIAQDSGRAARQGIRLHRSRTLSPADVTRRARIPVTKPARTLADLRRTIPSRQFAAALRQAEFLGLPLDDRVTQDHTRSELESRFLSICRRHRLPQPEVNVRVDCFVVDFLWRDERLIVELDGWQSHRTRSAFEEDRARDIRLKLLAFEVLRFTWRQVDRDPRRIASSIRSLLSR
jgi:very-short-patch-repair endonuclease